MIIINLNNESSELRTQELQQVLKTYYSTTHENWILGNFNEDLIPDCESLKLLEKFNFLVNNKKLH